MKNNDIRIIRLSTKIHFSFINHLHKESEKIGLSISYLPIISALAKKDGISQLEIVKDTCFSAPSISLTLNKMEADEIITRKSDENDARLLRVFLTPKGLEYKELVKKMIDDSEKIAMKHLNSIEITQVEEILNKVLKNLNEESW